MLMILALDWYSKNFINYSEMKSKLSVLSGVFANYL